MLFVFHFVLVAVSHADYRTGGINRALKNRHAESGEEGRRIKAVIYGVDLVKAE